jgi:hypothetical protein
MPFWLVPAGKSSTSFSLLASTESHRRLHKAGHSQRQIAATLGLTKGTVQRAIEHARTLR